MEPSLSTLYCSERSVGSFELRQRWLVDEPACISSNSVHDTSWSGMSNEPATSNVASIIQVSFRFLLLYESGDSQLPADHVHLVFVSRDIQIIQRLHGSNAAPPGVSAAVTAPS